MNISLVLYKLFRVKPTVAWAVSGFLLAVSVAINEFGFGLNWYYLILSLLVIINIQALLAHAVNDLFDECVDRITDMKGTNRFKVLVSGLATRKDLTLICVMSLVNIITVIYYLYRGLGFYILVFGAVGLYAPLAYSVKPLRLGWRPFSEWTIVFPTLVTLVVAVDFVATGSLSKLAFYTGIVFALFNIIWFLVSRYMDYEPDKKAGKITSAVYFGAGNAFRKYFIIIFLTLTMTSSLLMFYCNSVFLITLLLITYIIVNIEFDNIENPIIASVVRTELIYISIINSLVLSAAFIAF